MKRYLLIICACLLGAIALQAQPRGAHRHCAPNPKMFKEITDFKINFLAEKMSLSADQKEKFTRLYSEMSEQKRKIFDEIRAADKALRDNKEPSDKDYEEASRKIADAKIRDARLEKEYDAKFATFLSAKQIYQMKQGEEQFRRRCTEMHHKRRQGDKPPRLPKKQKPSSQNSSK